MEGVYLKKGTEEYTKLIKKCENQKGAINSLQLCANCWSFLSPYQKSRHTKDHKFLYTPVQFSSEEQLIVIDKKFGKYQLENSIVSISPIKDNPLKCYQRLNFTEETKTENSENQTFASLNEVHFICNKDLIYLLGH